MVDVIRLFSRFLWYLTPKTVWSNLVFGILTLIMTLVFCILGASWKPMFTALIAFPFFLRAFSEKFREKVDKRWRELYE